MRATEVGRGKEGPMEGIIPRGGKKPGTRLRAEKGGGTDEVHGRHRHASWESRGQEEPGNQAGDKREGSAETSGGGRQEGATSMWKSTPRPGELGRRSGCNREK